MNKTGVHALSAVGGWGEGQARRVIARMARHRYRLTQRPGVGGVFNG